MSVSFTDQCRDYLEGISSCQSPLLADAKVRTTKNHLLSNTWCPSTADQGSYLFISLANLTYITRANIQSISPEIFYYLHYTRDNTIDSSTTWRSYRLLNNQQATISLDPPIIAKHLRLSFKLRRTSACIQFEFFGCPFTDGVVSYSMLQGVNQLEDETYDGEYDELHRYLSGMEIVEREKPEWSHLISFPFCQGGLGQLSDGKTGPDNREDIDGLQWVSDAEFLSFFHSKSEHDFRSDGVNRAERDWIIPSRLYSPSIHCAISLVWLSIAIIIFQSTSTPSVQWPWSSYRKIHTCTMPRGSRSIIHEMINSKWLDRLWLT